MKVLTRFSLLIAILAVLTIGALGLTAAEPSDAEVKVSMDPGGGGHVISPDTDVAYGTVGTFSDPGGGGH